MKISREQGAIALTLILGFVLAVLLIAWHRLPPYLYLVVGAVYAALAIAAALTSRGTDERDG